MRLANVAGRAALVVDDGIVDVAVASGGALPSDPQLLYERWDEVRALAERVTKAAAPLDVRVLQAPVPSPRQVFAIGMNYAAHAAEAGLENPTFPRRSRSSRRVSRGRTRPSSCRASSSTGRSSWWS